MLIIGCLETFLPIEIGRMGPWGDAGMIVLVLTMATGLSYLSFNIAEKPLIEVRRRRRERSLERG